MISKNEAIAPLFFRDCIELSVESYVTSINEESSAANAYNVVDALARLIVLLIVHHKDSGGEDDNNARVILTTKVLSIIVLVLVHAHEQVKTAFNQKPYMRLFSTLLNDLHLFQEPLSDIYIQILSAMRFSPF